MSQRAVGIVIDRLLTDIELRGRFVVDRLEALAALSVMGLELTSDEFDLFIRTDARVWFIRSHGVSGRIQ